MHIKLGGKLLNSLRFETQFLERLQSVSVVDGAAHTQKDDVESNGGSLENVAEIFVLFLCGKTRDQVYYHPCFNVSHYANPRGVGITNTISRAELAAIAATIIHGYSHIATDSQTSMHQIRKRLSHLKPPPPPHQGRCPPIHCQSNPPVTIAHSFPQSQIPRRYYRQ